MKIFKDIIIILLMFNALSSYALETEICGVVRDSATRETLPYVSIYLKNTTKGVVSDLYGTYSIVINEPGTLIFSMVGYRDYKVNVKADGIKRNIKVNLSPDNYSLEEVVVKPKHIRYKNKNNPAVDLVKEIIDKKELNSVRNHEYASFDQYQKISYAWNEFEEHKHTMLSRKFGFLYDHIDTSRYGKSILTVGLRECLTTHYYQREPERDRSIIRAQKQNGIDEIFPQEGVKKTLDEMFQEVDIFQNDVQVLSNHFVSPLSNIAPSFYKYYILDTVVVAGDSCINLAFTPRTTEAYGFIGNLYVTLDSSRFIHHVHYNIPKDINLNFVETMYFEQDFSKSGDGTRLMNRDYVCVEFFVPGLPRVYGERLNSFKNYSFEEPKNSEIFKQSIPEIEAKNSQNLSASAWDTLRHTPLKGEELRTDSLMSQLETVKIYRGLRSFLDICVNNYLPTKKVGSQFDYGPFFSTISTNRLEGLRIRLGGETTTFFDKHLFVDTYVAYGFRDKLPKGMASLEYSINQKKLYHFEYPIHSIKVYGKYDVGKVGESFVGYDNILSSLFSRTDDRNAIYQREAGLIYQNELYSGFSFSVDLKYKTLFSTWLTAFNRYDAMGKLSSIDDYSTTTAKVLLRYSPKEKFYQSRRFRYRLNEENPVFTLSHTFGLNGVLGSDYTYNRTEFGFEKRVWLSYFGYMDFFFKATKIWNDVPYTLLDVPDAGCSYTMKDQAFNLLDPVEFVNSQSLTWDIMYNMNGLILNRIPLIRKLQLREFVLFKGVWGTLSDNSNPTIAQNKEGLFELPSTSYALDRIPYMEGGVGLDNVLKLFRICYVWRITYRNHLDVPVHGVRFALHLNF